MYGEIIPIIQEVWRQFLSIFWQIISLPFKIYLSLPEPIQWALVFLYFLFGFIILALVIKYRNEWRYRYTN